MSTIDYEHWSRTELVTRLRQLEQVEERLRSTSESEARYRSFVEQAVDGIFLADPSGRYLDANSAGTQMLGYTLEELRKLTVNDVIDSQETARMPEQFNQLDSGDVVISEWVFLRKDGATFSGEVVGRRLPDGCLLGILRDISARKRQECELDRQRALLESVMNTTNVMLVLLDAAFNFVWVNAAYARTCSMSPEAMIGRNHFAIYPHAENEAIFRQVRDTGQGVCHKDKPFEFADQTERGITYWDWSLDPVRDGLGEVTGLVFSLRETTQFKRIELALAASEARYRSLAEQVSDGIFVADASGCFLDVNQAGAAMLGYSRDEIINRTIEDILFPEETMRLPGEIARFADGSVVRSEWLIRRKDGSSFAGEVLGRRLADGHLQGVLRDISERKQVEGERLAAIARHRDALVQEVHHRIKNHLHGVLGLLSAQASANSALAAPLADIAAQIKAIAAVYGLQASTNSDAVELGQMLTSLANGAVGPVPVNCRIATTGPVHVAKSHSIPLALAINELIVNALKHLDRPDPRRPVQVVLERIGSAVRLMVRGGPAHLPAGFDFDLQQETGLGLELVGTLLPGSDVRLCFEQRHDEVCAELWLEAPAIHLPRR